MQMETDKNCYDYTCKTNETEQHAKGTWIQCQEINRVVEKKR